MQSAKFGVSKIVYKNYIGGAWRESSTRKKIEVENPATGEKIGEAECSSLVDVKETIDLTKKSFKKSDWRRNPKKRYEAMIKLASLIEDRLEFIAHTLTRENGKPIKESRMEVNAAVDMLKYFAGMSRNVFGRSATLEPNNFGTIVKEAIGVVAIITPWNWPVLLLMRELAPALAAGNAVIVKPASYTPLSTLEIFNCIAEIEEFEPGIINVITGPGSEIGSELAGSQDVDMVSFTGDTSTGRTVMQLATNNFKKIALELGGKSPNIVFADANLEKAIQTIGQSIFISAGQMCFAGTRVIVHESVKEKVVSGLKQFAEKLVVGNGLEDGTDMGPVAAKSQLDTVQKYCDIARAEGKIVTGGYRLTGEQYDHGYFFAPTIVDGLDINCEVIQEEIFGPILAVQSFKDDEEAISLANCTMYGLTAGVWTNDINRAHRVSRDIEAGTVWINTYNRNFAEMEFGGYKKSGYGRTRGIDGLMEYTETKHINIELYD